MAVGLLSNKYSWMHEVDPSIPPSAIEDGAGNRALFRILLLGLVTTPQLIILVMARGRTERVVAWLLIAVAVLVGFVL